MVRFKHYTTFYANSNLWFSFINTEPANNTVYLKASIINTFTTNGQNTENDVIEETVPLPLFDSAAKSLTRNTIALPATLLILKVAIIVHRASGERHESDNDCIKQCRGAITGIKEALTDMCDDEKFTVPAHKSTFLQVFDLCWKAFIKKIFVQTKGEGDTYDGDVKTGINKINWKSGRTRVVVVQTGGRDEGEDGDKTCKTDGLRAIYAYFGMEPTGMTVGSLSGFNLNQKEVINFFNSHGFAVKRIFPGTKEQSTKIPFHNLWQILAKEYVEDQSKFNDGVLLIRIDDRHLTTAGVGAEGTLHFLEDLHPLPQTIHITDLDLFILLPKILHPTVSEPVMSTLEIHIVKQQQRSTKRRQKKRKRDPTPRDLTPEKPKPKQQRAMLQCAECSEIFVKETFSKSQLKKKAKRRCPHCIKS